MKICFLPPMPSPYMEDFFSAINNNGEIEILVLYETMAMSQTHWGDRDMPKYAKVLGAGNRSWVAKKTGYHSQIGNELRAAKADLYVVQGYSSLTHQAAFRWLIKNKKTWVFWWERPGLEKRGFLGESLRAQAMRPVLESADGLVGIGSLAVDSYQRLLKRDLPIANIPYLCRVDQFQQAANRHREHREESAPVTILYCGQLIPRKGVETLIASYQRLRRASCSVKLRCIGTGPDRQRLDEMLNNAEREHVEFTGFKPVDQLPELFGQSDIFVLPSLHDGWGVVVNQAIAAGLPVIYSDRVGAGYDLVRENDNGYRFPVEDVESLTAKLKQLVEQPDLRQRMGKRSYEESYNWTPERGAEMWKTFADEVRDRATSLTSAHNPKMISN